MVQSARGIMIIGITLDKTISCENICKNIQNLVNSFQKNNPDLSNSIMTISIKNISETQIPDVPKLEYKNSL